MITTGSTDVSLASIVHFSVPKCTISKLNNRTNTRVKQQVEIKKAVDSGGEGCRP